MQVILELDDCSIRVYRSFAEHIQYSSSFSHNHLIRAINHCYQVGQYLKHHAKKPPKILKLCLRVSRPELFFQKCLPISYSKKLCRYNRRRPSFDFAHNMHQFLILILLTGAGQIGGPTYQNHMLA